MWRREGGALKSKTAFLPFFHFFSPQFVELLIKNSRSNSGSTPASASSCTTGKWLPVVGLCFLLAAQLLKTLFKHDDSGNRLMLTSQFLEKSIAIKRYYNLTRIQRYIIGYKCLMKYSQVLNFEGYCIASSYYNISR